MTEKKIEPHRENSTCVYCGDAPINHSVFYTLSILSMIFDNHIISTTKKIPEFIKSWVDHFIYFTFDIFIFLHLAYLSDDIDKATTFRSRVVWEEARRRGIEMKQVVLFGKFIDQYRTILNGRRVYFNSLPIDPNKADMKKNWDDKFVLKRALMDEGIPVPRYTNFIINTDKNLQKIFSKLEKPIIVKPRIGSRGRHTVTNIKTLEDFKTAVKVSGQICANLVAEEHLEGYVCRATLVNGKLMGFYRGGSPSVVGDGVHSISELIELKDKNRGERIEKILVNQEMISHIKRAGFEMNDVLPTGQKLKLSYRTGRLFGGETREMLDELHPSFVPILEKASSVVDLVVVGFDCIIPNPHLDMNTQKWGIIECNTLPFIDLHYYALEGKPKNIAGAIWDVFLRKA